jgi:hypothetical protein
MLGARGRSRAWLISRLADGCAASLILPRLKFMRQSGQSSERSRSRAISLKLSVGVAIIECVID